MRSTFLLILSLILPKVCFANVFDESVQILYGVTSFSFEKAALSQNTWVIGQVEVDEPNSYESIAKSKDDFLLVKEGNIRVVKVVKGDFDDNYVVFTSKKPARKYGDLYLSRDDNTQHFKDYFEGNFVLVGLSEQAIGDRYIISLCPLPPEWVGDVESVLSKRDDIKKSEGLYGLVGMKSAASSMLFSTLTSGKDKWTVSSSFVEIVDRIDGEKSDEIILSSVIDVVKHKKVARLEDLVIGLFVATKRARDAGKDRAYKLRILNDIRQQILVSYKSETMSSDERKMFARVETMRF